MELDEKIDLVLDNVSIYALFAMAPIPVKYETDTIECQISCPFHGRDLHKSARVYPQSNSFYCWGCDQTWDVIDFWAQANEMWKDDGNLNRGHAINDLIMKFKLRSNLPDWKKRLDENLKKFSNESGGYEAATMTERLRLRNFYQSRSARWFRSFDTAIRQAEWTKVRDLWDALDDVDLEDDAWRDSLIAWNENATDLKEAVDASTADEDS